MPEANADSHADVDGRVDAVFDRDADRNAYEYPVRPGGVPNRDADSMRFARVCNGYADADAVRRGDLSDRHPHAVRGCGMPHAD